MTFSVKVSCIFESSAPQRVLDENEYILDIDGWQNLIKDAEDLEAAWDALEKYPNNDIGSPEMWAWKQKSIKALNRTDNGVLVTSETRIKGHYVKNKTGCARTEGIFTISDAEKSKYLPHFQNKDTIQRLTAIDSNHMRSTRAGNRQLVAEKGLNFHQTSQG